MKRTTIVELQNDINKDWIPLATPKQRELLRELGYEPLSKLSKLYASFWIEKILKDNKKKEGGKK